MTAATPADVMIVTMSFPAPSEAFAGVEVRALRRLGARVRVRALRPPHPMTRELLSDWGLEGLDVTHLQGATAWRSATFLLRHPRMGLNTALWLVRRTWRNPLSLLRALALLPRCIEIFDECLRSPPQVLHLFWGHYPAVVGHMALRWSPETHVSTSLGAYDLVQQFEPGLDVARRSDSVWTQAGCNRAELVHLGVDPARLRVLLRGVDLQRTAEVPAKRRRGVAQVVCVARLERNKGVGEALRAFAAVADRHPEVSLAILGEGPQLGELRRLAKALRVEHRVDFRGPQTHSNVLSALHGADVFMLLSSNPSERIPNALKEAMACGCACIVTRTPGLDEIAGAWSRPMIVDQGDWQAAARHLDAVLTDPTAWDQDREAARRFVLEHLDASRVAAERLAAWRGEHGIPRCAA